MEYIDGNIVKGFGVASGGNLNWNYRGSIEMQMDYFKQVDKNFYKKISNCFLGTLNIFIENRRYLYDKISWDFKFFNARWISQSQNWSEDLFFKKINIEFNKKIYTAWIYYASKSPHQKNMESNIIEILSPYISNIKNQKKCKILLDL